MSIYTDLDLTHQPDDHPDWQEAFVLVFRDRATNAVGFLRTGAYVNRGLSQVHWGMALPDGTRFRRNRARVPYDPADRTERSARTGTYTSYSVEADHVRFQGQDPDAEADLRFYDFFPSQDWDAIGVEAPRHLQGGSGHPESSGRVEGRIRLGDRVIEITDGIGHRDHSFGPRPHHVFRTARWHAGTVGPALSYSLVTMAGEDGLLHKFGWIMRDGRRENIRDFHTVNMTLSDGYSTIGGWTAVMLESGERLRIEAETVDGIVTSSHEVNGGPGSSPAGIEAVSIARWNGHEGVCDFNMIDNPHLGDQAVVGTLLANIDDGLSQRPFDPSWVR
jgi:hypothetical protein